MLPVYTTRENRDMKPYIPKHHEEVKRMAERILPPL